MINELIFFASILITMGLTLCALRLGKEALVGAMIMQGVIANIFLVKEITLFGRLVSSADVFIVGVVLCLNLLQEYFGRQTATRTINAYVFTLVWFLAVRTMHLWYAPSPADITHNHFEIIFANSPRIIASTLAISYLALHLDRLLYRFLLNIMGHRFLPLRNFLTVGISQLFDTVAFSYLALYGILSSIPDVIMVSYGVKLFTLAVMTPFMSLAQYLEPKKYGF